MTDLLLAAKQGDVNSFSQLFLHFRPVITRRSYVGKAFHFDLFQELCIVFIDCVDTFEPEKI